MFSCILVPLDGSALAEVVLPHLAAIARTGQPRIFLIRVLDPAGQATRPVSVDPFDWQIRKAEAETYLHGLVARLEEAGLQAVPEVREGRAAETVIEFAREVGAGLILMSSHGQSGISGWNVSSVVQKIILRARQSVMIVRAYQPVDAGLDDLYYRRILLPLDASPRAEVVLAQAAALARANGAECIVAHVVKKPEMPRRTPPTQEDIELGEQVIERNRAEAFRYLEEIKGRIDSPVETRLLVSESEVEALHTLVEEEGVDLVILSAHGYSGATRWPYGSTVISFIAYGTTPLLVVQDLPADRIEP